MQEAAFRRFILFISQCSGSRLTQQTVAGISLSGDVVHILLTGIVRLGNSFYFMFPINTLTLGIEMICPKPRVGV